MEFETNAIIIIDMDLVIFGEINKKKTVIIVKMIFSRFTDKSSTHNGQIRIGFI